jgi:hypothetical protein
LVSVGVVASVKDIVGFYFGGYASSTQKDATIAAMASQAADPAPDEPNAQPMWPSVPAGALVLVWVLFILRATR